MHAHDRFVANVFFLSVCFIAHGTCLAQPVPSSEACKVAAAYSHSQKGTGVLVMVQGKVVFEDYAEGWNADKPHLLASGTKSFCGVMAGCAVHDGLLTLDEKVADTLTEWKEDKRKSQVTIRQLLSLCSG
ncbi:MAG: serine hydrolase, partial [Pirellula sp.]